MTAPWFRAADVVDLWEALYLYPLSPQRLGLPLRPFGPPLTHDTDLHSLIANSVVPQDYLDNDNYLS